MTRRVVLIGFNNETVSALEQWLMTKVTCLECIIFTGKHPDWSLVHTVAASNISEDGVLLVVDPLTPGIPLRACADALKCSCRIHVDPNDFSYGNLSSELSAA